MNPKFSNTALFCCAIFLAIVTFIKPRYLEQHTNATLAWDVSGYYLYLPAIFIYDDLDNLEFLPEIIEKYTPSPSIDQAYQAANGNMVMKYSAGMAVLYSPAFFISHAIAKITDYPADGFSLPYQAGIHWWSVFIAVVGLFFLKKILSRYFDESTAGWSLILITFGTNFLNYSTFDAANTHDYLFTIMAVLTWCSIQFHDSYRWKYAIGIGLSIGLAALTRPTEVLFAMIPVLWGVYDLESLKERINTLLKQFPKIIVAVLIVAAIGSIQLIYWKTVSGNWLEYSYQDQGFSFLHPHFLDVFFSYRKGWLIYTPIMTLALLGFVFLLKNHKKLFPIIFFFFLINTWIICAWDIWWYGGAFGQRAFIQSYTLLAFPLAAFIYWAKNQAPGFLKTTIALFAVCCTALNVFQTYQAHWGPFETEAMTKAYYWRIFGKTKNDPYDRLLLDAKEGYSGKKENAALLLEESFESIADTTTLSKDFSKTGNWSTFTDINKIFSPPINVPFSEKIQKGKWLSISAWFYSPKMNWDYWRMPQLVVRFEKNDNPVKERIIRPFRVTQPNQWAPVGMDIKVPEKEFDNIEIFLWNAGGIDVAMFMDDLKVEVFE